MKATYGNAAPAAQGFTALDIAALLATADDPNSLIDSITAQGDGWYRINFADLTSDTTKYDDIDTECAKLSLDLGVDFDELFGYKIKLQTRNSTTTPHIYTGAGISNNTNTEGLMFQLDEYSSGGYKADARGFDGLMVSGAAGSGGAGTDQLLRGKITHNPTSGDLQWSYQQLATADATVEVNKNQNNENETLTSGDAFLTVVIGGNANNLGSGEYVDVKVAYKADDWS